MNTRRTVNIDLYGDLISFLRSELTRIGYASPHKLGSKELLRIYLDVCKRLVAPRPRKIHRAQEFFCPAQLLRPLMSIERSIQSGEDITPYLSEKIKKLRYNDRILNDWGIHHLHLGKRIRRNGFVCRTNMLLLCRFEQNDAYFVGIRPHNSWAEQELVGIMHKNWPEMLRRFRLNGVIGAPISNVEINELRRKNCNYCLEMTDGTVYAPPGGGMMGNGTNAQSVMTASRVCDLLQWEQERIVDNIDEIAEKALEKGVRLPESTNFKMIVLDSVFCVVEHTSGVTLRLNELSNYALGRKQADLS